MKKRWNSSKIVVQKYFSTQKMFLTIPKYHGGTMSHCTILDLCHTVQQFQIYFLSFAKVKTRCFLLFGTEKYSNIPIQLESLVYVLFSKSKMFDKKMSEKERVAKYREENKRATELATRKSNFKRTQLLASGTLRPFLQGSPHQGVKKEALCPCLQWWYGVWCWINIVM